MNILVYNVAAETSGALMVLNDFYNDVRNHSDKSINWYFVLSIPRLDEMENIRVLRYPWVKKSWIHRIYFDKAIAPSLIKKLNIDIVFSMQNIMLSNINKKQVVYLHQSLPFIDYKFQLKENRLFWLYQNVISKTIYNSIRKADLTIIQTNWMKSACINKTGVTDDKLIVIKPNIKIEIKEYFYNCEKNRRTFFYPATAFQNKNHMVILKACEELQGKGINNFQVVFTLNGDENEYSKNLKQYTMRKKLNIKFIGTMDRSVVFDWYSKSVLIFPSYIETLGLPLLEARKHKSIVFASDTLFSHEILDGYNNSYFFNPFDYYELSNLMASIINDEIFYNEIKENLLNKEVEKTIINTLLEECGKIERFVNE